MGRHAVNRSRTTVSLIALGAAAALVAGILSVNGAATADAPRLSDNLIPNLTADQSFDRSAATTAAEPMPMPIPVFRRLARRSSSERSSSAGPFSSSRPETITSPVHVRLPKFRIAATVSTSWWQNVAKPNRIGDNENPLREIMD